MKLTNNEIRDINRYLEKGKPLPEKYRFLLFEDKREVELVWNGKISEVCNVVLPFQVIEQVDEPREEKTVKLQMDLFDMQTGQQIKGWNYKLIWGDNKLILSSLKNGPLREEIEAQGGGDFIYCELMKYNEAFMDKIQVAITSKELVKIWKNIAKNSFLNWYVNSEMPEEAINDFIEIGKAENGLDKQKKLLAELLNKNQLYVNLSEIDNEDFNVSEEDKELNRLFYGETYNG